MVGPCSKRQVYQYLSDKYDESKNLICKTIGLYRSTLSRVSTKDDSETEEKLKELAERYPRRGMDHYYGKIRMQGLIWNRKRVRRVYNKMGLKLRRKYRTRINRPYKEGLVQPIFPVLELELNWQAFKWILDYVCRKLKFRPSSLTNSYIKDIKIIDAQSISFKLLDRRIDCKEMNYERTVVLEDFGLYEPTLKPT